MATTLSARRHYRKQVKSSACRGKVKNSCRKAPSAASPSPARESLIAASATSVADMGILVTT